MSPYTERLDRAARILCEMRGQDPDQEVSEPGLPAMWQNPHPRWHDAREELRLHQQRDEAFEMAGQP